MLRTSITILILASVVSTAPITPRDLPDWLYNIFHPNPGNGSAAAQIQCYALPYGGLGIASHVLTYLTAIILFFGLEPLRPWKRLKPDTLPKLWNTALGVVSTVVTVVIAAITMKSCRGGWPFMLIAFWKMTLSFSIGMLSIIGPWHHAAYASKEVSSKSRGLPWIFLPYVVGTISGIIGVFALVHVNFNTNRNVWILTITIIACASFAILCAILIAVYIAGSDGVDKGFGVFGLALLLYLVIFVVLMVFYSDLVLAALNGNWAGTPSSDFALLYWLYFACKRLPMLSI